MTALYCNQCGHPERPGTATCAVCGAVLEDRPDHPTATALDPVEAALADLSRRQLEALAATRPAKAGLLIVARGHKLGARFELDGDVTRVGRDATADVFLDDITVSRRHAEVRRIGPDSVLIDLDSLNGTYLNGARVERAVLHEGDQLQVGKFKLLFFAPGEPRL